MSKGILISRDEIALLPASGQAWGYLKGKADQAWRQPDITNQDDEENVRVLARAFVAVRLGLTGAGGPYRDSVIRSCMAIIGTEGGRTLALGRELMAYVVAADLVGLPAEDETRFKAWLGPVRRKNLDGKTLISTHEVRPNNWGTICGASRAACAVYLDDLSDLNRSALVFRGWLGDRAAYSGFTYGDLSWQSNPAAPVGINPAGSQIQGHLVDGALPEEMRRSGDFRWPPPKENYAYTGLEGAVLQAVILARFGFPEVWAWQSRAMGRAFRWLNREANYPATGNDCWMVPIINFVEGTNWSQTTIPAPLSRAVIGGDWWYASAKGAGGTTPSPETPKSFRVAYDFLYQPAQAGNPAGYVCHDDLTEESVDGAGTTPDLSLKDWVNRNPGKPTPR